MKTSIILTIFTLDFCFGFPAEVSTKDDISPLNFELGDRNAKSHRFNGNDGKITNEHLTPHNVNENLKSEPAHDTDAEHLLLNEHNLENTNPIESQEVLDREVNYEKLENYESKKIINLSSPISSQDSSQDQTNLPSIHNKKYENGKSSPIHNIEPIFLNNHVTEHETSSIKETDKNQWSEQTDHSVETHDHEGYSYKEPSIHFKEGDHLQESIPSKEEKYLKSDHPTEEQSSNEDVKEDDILDFLKQMNKGDHKDIQHNVDQNINKPNVLYILPRLSYYSNNFVPVQQPILYSFGGQLPFRSINAQPIDFLLGGQQPYKQINVRTIEPKTKNKEEDLNQHLSTDDSYVIKESPLTRELLRHIVFSQTPQPLLYSRPNYPFFSYI